MQKCAFFSNATALQSRISDISKCRLQEKCFFWVFWNSWKFPRERTYTEVIWLTKCFWKNLFTHFWENVGKIAVMKVLENYQKNVFNIVPFKNSSCPIHPSLTMSKTDSTATASFVCSEKLQNCWERVWGRITFWPSKTNFYVLQLCQEKSNTCMVCSENWLF